MLTLYDNAFSPFARKVRMALEYKQLPFEAIDGLHRDNHAALARVNARREVPVLVDAGLVVVNSAQILAYLDEAYPARPLLPSALAARVRARHWERISDTQVDAILLNVSLWLWAERPDRRPAWMEERARHDLDTLYAAMERELADGREFLVGELSIADLALFPHLRSVDRLGFPIPADCAHLTAWLARVQDLPFARDDVARLRRFFAGAVQGGGLETRRIFWRGDRLEWLLAAGGHAWLANEVREDRVSWPPTHVVIGASPVRPASSRP